MDTNKLFLVEWLDKDGAACFDEGLLACLGEDVLK